jgi:hypothetical protein
MKEVIAGRKKAIKTTDVKHLYAPQYETLSMEKILQFAFQLDRARITNFMPDDKDIPFLPRQVSQLKNPRSGFLTILVGHKCLLFRSW